MSSNRVQRDKPFFKYEEIAPRFRAQDPASKITVRSGADFLRVRRNVIDAVWGSRGIPLGKQIASVERDAVRAGAKIDCAQRADKRKLALPLDCALDLYRDMTNLAAVDRLRAEVPPGYISTAAHFRPIEGNGRLILYHHGFAGTYHEQHRHIRTLVARGYAVMAHNLMAYGENLSGVPGREREHRLDAPQPMRFFVEPVVVGVKYARANFKYRSIDIIGFSAGGYIAELAAAVDLRIRRSYIVASPYPIFLRASPTSGPALSRYKPLLDAAGELDLFVLASMGKSRGQLQIYNRFDRCCWRNRIGKLYETAVVNAVRRIGPGAFRLLIDETHARHKVSKFALNAIIADMERP